jgi:hypothetical protein
VAEIFWSSLIVIFTAFFTVSVNVETPFALFVDIIYISIKIVCIGLYWIVLDCIGFVKRRYTIHELNNETFKIIKGLKMY